MGKQSTTTAKLSSTTIEMTKPKKRKGRPPKNPLNYDSTPTIRSTRRKPLFNDDDEDEREKKKVKLLPEFEHSKQNNESGSGSELGPNNISVGDGSDDGVSVKAKEVKKKTDCNVNVLENGPTTTTPLPEKKWLLFILDRLQKKDTYGVFSDAVDPDELPDYFEIIDQPMDFGTVRKKLDAGDYRNVEELEADIFLICSNAMKYNDPDTVYYRQARSIQELANRDFQNLRNEGEDGEPQPKVVRRGRPPGTKLLKKTLETSPVDTAAISKASVVPERSSPVDTAAISKASVVPERSSGAALASVEEKETTIASNTPYNLRKTPMLSRFRSTNNFISSDWTTNWNDEFPAKIVRADMKHGSKHFMMDENRRHTYKEFSNSNSGSALSDFNGAKRLVMVGLQEPLAYARSLAKYAAAIGPVAWKIASSKIQATVPASVRYGPGWVGDNVTLPQQSSFSNEKQNSINRNMVLCNSAQHLTPSVPVPNSAVALEPSEAMIEAVRKLNSQNEQKPVFHSPVSNIMQQRYSLASPPDLNVRVHGSSPSPSNLQNGPPQQQQPDLVLQL